MGVRPLKHFIQVVEERAHQQTLLGQIGFDLVEQRPRQVVVLQQAAELHAPARQIAAS